jgi:hypothetical protein
MFSRCLTHRGIAAIAAFVLFVSGAIPARADVPTSDDQNSSMALMLFGRQTCAQRAAAGAQTSQYVAPSTPQPSEAQPLATGADAGQESPPPGQPPAVVTNVVIAQATAQPSSSPETTEAPGVPGPATPGPVNTPGLPTQPGGIGNGTYQLYVTPKPPPGVSPPPVPTPTPVVSPPVEPIFLERGGNTPPPITPAGRATPTPSPEPTGVATLAPNYVAVIADSVSGGAAKGQPGDADGNVHIFFRDEEIVGDHAHFDGIRTVTITGHPFLINHTHDSVLKADAIEFDTIQETAKLSKGNGETAEGVQIGFVHFSADDLHTNTDGTANGMNPYVTTCENPRAGYHITGKTIQVVPGDAIIITKAVMWLGAAAVFYLPRLVIPLRTVTDQRAKPRFFPEVGYDSYEGAWIKMQLPFGKDQYYYGYYIVNYFTKMGLGLGYVGFYASRRGRRTLSINFYGANDRLQGNRTYNVAIQEQENIDPHLRGNFQFGYQSNYGALTDIPPNESLTGAIVHQTQNTSQNYSFTRSSEGTEAVSNSLSFTDSRQFNENLSQDITYDISNSSSNYGESSFNAQSEFDYLMHYTTEGADYQLEYDKTFAQQPYGINKIPEVEVRPNDFFQHFLFPLSADLTVGEYSEPTSQLATWRTDMGLVLGPATYKVFNSDFEGTINVDQYAYGTGDLKAAISQDFSLTTPIGSHFLNSITYSEANYNGPALVPFQYLDQQPTDNTKNAQDLFRVFNDDTYDFSLGYSTNFDGVAQPWSYQLTARPSARSVVLLSGSFLPGPGQGFETTNLQLSTPFGRDASLQFVTDLQWKGGELFSDKVIYYTRTFGSCYQVQVLYSEASQAINVGLSLLAFPNQTATFAIGQPGQIVPSTFNF